MGRFSTNDNTSGGQTANKDVYSSPALPSSPPLGKFVDSPPVCSLDKQDLFEFIELQSPFFNPASFGYVCLPTVPQDEAWELLYVSSYFRFDDPTSNTILNALPGLYLIARGVLPPTLLNDTNFFQQPLPGSPANAGFPRGTVRISDAKDGENSTTLEQAQTGVQALMPPGIRSMLIPPGYTLMVWNGNSGIGNPAGVYRLGVRAVIKRSRTSIQPPVYF